MSCRHRKQGCSDCEIGNDDPLEPRVFANIATFEQPLNGEMDLARTHSTDGANQYETTNGNFHQL